METVKKYMGATQGEMTSAPAGEMNAVVYQGGKSVVLEHVPKPKLQSGNDVIVKVTACSICPGLCSSMESGEIPGVEKGQILGREAIGIVEQTGADVEKLKQGDRVVISFVVACGNCSFCRRDEFSACNRTNESKEFAQRYGGWAPAAIFGYSRLLGNLPGSQAEFVRVPYGDVNCFKVPNAVPNEKALFVAETATSGLHATELGMVQRGDSVVIWGLGPIGIMTAQWAKMKGAKCVIGVDLIHERLKLTYEQMGIKIVDRTGLSSEDVIKKIQSLLPDCGADVVIDVCGSSASRGWIQKMGQAVGMDSAKADVLTECVTVVRKYGHVGVIADYANDVDAFPIGHLMMKHLTFRAGQTPVQKYFKQVMEVIEAGELDPSMLITHRCELQDVPEAYMHACNKDEGYLKVFVDVGGGHV